VGQLQLAQPVLTLTWSALLLNEPVTLPAAGAALLVLACVVVTQRTRASRPAPAGSPPAATGARRRLRPDRVLRSDHELQ
jgi:hypothetical protein